MLLQINKSLALIFLFVTAIGWAMAGIFIKLLSAFNSFEIIVLRFLTALISLAVFIVLVGIWLILKIDNS